MCCPCWGSLDEYQWLKKFENDLETFKAEARQEVHGNSSINEAAIVLYLNHGAILEIPREIFVLEYFITSADFC